MFTGCLITLLVWVVVEAITAAVVIGLYAAIAALLGLIFSWRIAWAIVIIWFVVSSLFRLAAGNKK